MTEESKKRLRSLKDEVTARLDEIAASGYDGYRHALDTDERLYAYADDVCMHPDGHNLYEQLMLARFFDLVSRYEWKQKRVRNRIRFLEKIRFSGLNGRQSYRLTNSQCFIVAGIYGLSMQDGSRLIRDAYIEVPRKYGKTTFTAGLAAGELMVFGDDNAQVFVGANSYDQAKICFDEIRNIVRDVDSDERYTRVNREKITFKTDVRNAYAQCLTANAKTKDGLNASLVIMDEYSQARNTKTKNGADLKNVLTSSMGVRKNPLTIVITTASEVIDGPYIHELEGVLAILRGEVVNDRVFALIFMPDIDDREDDPKTWHKVQPHLGITVQENYYEIEWQRAQLSAENLMNFRTKQLNIFAINDAKVWFSPKDANRLVSDFNIDLVNGRPLTAVTFDLSVHDDFSAVSYTLYNGRDKSFLCHTDYYFPEEALEGHPNRELYLYWHRNGYLKLCKGKVIDVRMIAEDIIRRTKTLTIIRFGYDAYKAQDLVNILGTLPGGREALHPYSQTYGSFNLPVESFEMLALRDEPLIHFNDNPINVYCLTNCKIDKDNLENKKPIKVSENRKIDGTITMLMGLGILFSYERNG